MPRYDPRVHKLCEAEGCCALNKLYRFPYWQPTLSKMICWKCRNKASVQLAGGQEPIFLLTLDDKAEMSASEMVIADMGDPEECAGCGGTNCGERCVHSY